MMPTFTTAPLSTAEAGTGAAACASGIHTCIGTRPALVPKPATSSARITLRSGDVASAAAASRRRRLSPGISPASITSPTSSTDSASSASTR